MTTSDTYFEELLDSFESHQNPLDATPMRAYMKDQFEFYGIKSKQRRDLSRPFLKKEALLPWSKVPALIQKLWDEPQREIQYFAMELLAKYYKQWTKETLDLFVFMITHKSWWDTVDFISSNLVGKYFSNRQEEASDFARDLNQSGHLWLERCSILFQLKYKESTNTELLEQCIVQHKDSPEFFHRKAIGWALREYSKTNPEWVRSILEKHKFSGLTIREGSKYI